MPMIYLTPKQVAKYLTSCFYRPSVFPNEQDAMACKQAIDSLVEVDHPIGWMYNPSTDNKPTLAAAISWNDTPQGHAYWSAIHNKIMDTVGYDKLIWNILDAEQKMVMLEVPGIDHLIPIKKHSNLKVNPLKSIFDKVGEIEDPNETREII